MKRSWLVQRLEQPREHDNPFSFGGGLRNGGLSGDAMDLLRPLFSFAYMGAAEYEFGDVPRAFEKMTKHDELEAWEVEVPLKDVPESWEAARDRKARGERKKPDKGSVSVYVLAPPAWRDEVDARVTYWATHDPYGKQTDESRQFSVRDATRLPGALRPHNEWDADTRGWVELDNGFMFFTDREMWENVTKLFLGDETEE